MATYGSSQYGDTYTGDLPHSSGYGVSTYGLSYYGDDAVVADGTVIATALAVLPTFGTTTAVAFRSETVTATVLAITALPRAITANSFPTPAVVGDPVVTFPVIPSPPLWLLYLDDRSLESGAAPALSNDYLLTQAIDRSVSFYLDQPHTAQFSIDGYHPEALLIDELIHDLVIERNGTAIFRGRIGASADSVSTSEHKVSFNAVSYKGLLDRRVLHDVIDTQSSPVDQATIAWNMIAATQGYDAGDLGITRGSGITTTGTGVLRGDKWEYGSFIGESITSMGLRNNGFEWDIDTSNVFRIYYPNRGQLKSFPLDFGGNVVSLSRTSDPSRFANRVHTQGTVSDSPVWVDASAPDLDTSRPEGLWELVANADSSTSTTNAQITAIAQGHLTEAAAYTPSYTLTLRQGTWQSPDDFWLGDTVTLIITSGRLNVLEAYRVQSISLSLNTSGEETVTVTLGSPRMSVADRLWRYGRRIDNLESR